MAKRIPLTNSKSVVLVSDIDSNHINRYEWALEKRNNIAVTYIRIIEGRLIKLPMHRYIMNLGYKNGGGVHHINGNKLDNRRINLIVGRGDARTIKAKWRSKYKQKAHAQNKITYALKSGKIKRPYYCSNCEIKCKPESHHPDYTKPLYVVWLCRKCHLWKHKNYTKYGHYLKKK